MAVFNASLDPCTSDFNIMFNSSLFFVFSNKVVLSLAKILFLEELFFANSAIFFASSSDLVTKNSAPAKAEPFIPSISTGIEGNASFIISPS